MRDGARRVRRNVIKGGFLVQPEFSAVGGVAYERQPVRTDGAVQEARVVRKADNADVLKDSKAIIGAAYYTMERTCLNTPVGYFCDPQMLIEVRDALSDIQKAAGMFNEMSAMLGSDRRVTIDLYELPLPLENEHLIRRLLRLVVDRLSDVRTALRNGDRKEFEAVHDKARNLDKITTGVNSDAIRLALDLAKDRKRELLDQLRSGADPRVAGSRLDLSSLDAAINLFSAEPVGGSVEDLPS